MLALAGGGIWLLRDRVVWPAPRPAFSDGSASSGWLRTAGDILVPVVDAAVNGEPVRALIDSGAQATVVDRGLAERLGLLTGVAVPVVAFGVGGAPQTGRAVSFEAQLGVLSIRGLRAAAMDLGVLGALRGSGPPVSLVIGQDVLRTVVLDLDLPHGRLAFHAQGLHVPPAGSISVIARTRGRELFTDIRVEEVELEVAVDTGLSGTLALSEDVALSTGLLAPGRPMRRIQSLTFGGPTPGREVIAETLEIGDRTLRRAPVSVYARGTPSLLPAGLLGSGAFRRTRVVLDLGRSRLLLAPDREVGEEAVRRG